MAYVTKCKMCPPALVLRTAVLFASTCCVCACVCGRAAYRRLDVRVRVCVSASSVCVCRQSVRRRSVFRLFNCRSPLGCHNNMVDHHCLFILHTNTGINRRTPRDCANARNASSLYCALDTGTAITSKRTSHANRSYRRLTTIPAPLGTRNH